MYKVRTLGAKDIGPALIIYKNNRKSSIDFQPQYFIGNCQHRRRKGAGKAYKRNNNYCAGKFIYYILVGYYHNLQDMWCTDTI